MPGKTTSNTPVFFSPQIHDVSLNESANTQQSNVPPPTSDRTETNKLRNQSGNRLGRALRRAASTVLNPPWMSSNMVNKAHDFFLGNVMDMVEKHYPQALNPSTHPLPSHGQKMGDAPPVYTERPTNSSPSTAGAPLQHEKGLSAGSHADASTNIDALVRSCVDRIYADTAERFRERDQSLPQSNTPVQPMDNPLKDYLETKVADGKEKMQTLLGQITTLEAEHASLKAEHAKLPPDSPEAETKKREMENKQQQIDTKLGEIHQHQTRQSVLESLLQMQKKGELDEIVALLEADAQWSKRANKNTLSMIS